MRVGYHTHDVDFHPWEGGETPLERLLQRLDPRVADIELDLYWCVKGGSEPRYWFDRHPGRFPLVHVKDAGPAPDFKMADVGAGAMDWRAIFAQRRRAGMKHYYVEHDEPADPWASVTASFRYLSHLSV
jgi:sugar phosphate isomerase/epimerase